MRKSRDIFRPFDPRTAYIYDAFTKESKHRDGRTVEEWIEAERQAVLKAAIAVAEKHGLPAPTLADVECAERSAMGHADYALKWSWGIMHTMTERAEASKLDA